jgi:tetratricopeptide (TPR) repeat protein
MKLRSRNPLISACQLSVFRFQPSLSTAQLRLVYHPVMARRKKNSTPMVTSASGEFASHLNPSTAIVRAMKRTFKTIALTILLMFSLGIAAHAAPADSARDYVNRAMAKGNKGDYAGAIADANHAIALDPKCADAYKLRRAAQGSIDELDKAIADFDRAIKIDPKFAKAYFDRAKAKKGKGDLKGANADFNRAIALDPTLAHAPR